MLTSLMLLKNHYKEDLTKVDFLILKFKNIEVKCKQLLRDVITNNSPLAGEVWNHLQEVYEELNSLEENKKEIMKSLNDIQEMINIRSSL